MCYNAETNSGELFKESDDITMASITLNNQLLGLATYIPNDFIDKHMAEANGEYVKIYLYLLRCMGQPEPDLSIGKIADHFDHTEKDVRRALSYWEKMKLLRLEYDAQNDLTGICILTGAGEPEAETRPAAHTAPVRAAQIPERCTPSNDQISAFCDREDVRELIFLTETYLGRTISRSDLDHIFSWYDQLHFSAELIEFLVESCITKGHSNLRYMQKVAEDWFSQGIQTPEQAKNLVCRNNETYYVVLKSFGIRGRSLVPSEMDMLKKWSDTYGFSKELIAEACDRTIQKIREPRFEYADSILTSWHKNGLHTLDAVKKADEAFAKQQTADRPKAANRLPQPTRFSNFQERDVDYDALSQQLLAKSIQ